MLKRHDLFDGGLQSKMKKLLSLTLALTLTLSAVAPSISYAATPAKTTPAKTTTVAKQPAAPTNAQVQSLFTAFNVASLNGNEKVVFDTAIYTPEDKAFYEFALRLVYALKAIQKHYVTIHKVYSIKALGYSKATGTYSYNISHSTFLAMDETYQLTEDVSILTVKYDTAAKKYKLLAVEEVSSTQITDLTKSPYYGEILKAIAVFGEDYVNAVKTGKQPVVNTTNSLDSYYIKSGAPNLAVAQKEIPVTFENIDLTAKGLMVQTKDGQTASMTIDLKDFVNVFYSLDLYPQLDKDRSDVSVEIVANGVSAGSQALDSEGMTYELLEDQQIKLIFSAKAPFLIEKLYLDRN